MFIRLIICISICNGMNRIVNVSLSLPANINMRQSRQWALLLLGSLLLVFLRFDAIPVGLFFDDAHYLVLAESLANGDGYHLINYPHAPVEDAFPPGWPLLLTPAALLFPGNMVVPRLISLAFWLGALWLVLQLLGSRLERPFRWLLLLLVALNPNWVGAAGTAMSEPAYLCFTLLALWLWQQWRRPEASNGWLVGALAAAVYAALIRTIGISLLAGLLVSGFLTLPKRQRRFIFGGLGILLLALLPIFWFNARNGGMLFFSSLYSEHVQYVTANAGRFLRFWAQTAVSTERLADGVLPIFELGQANTLLGSAGLQLLSWAVLALVGLGFVLSLRKSQASEWYVLFYSAIFYVWIVYIDKVQPRILLPLIPFMYFYLVTTVAWISGKVRQPQQARATQVGMSVLGLLALLLLAHNVYSAVQPKRDQALDLTAGSSWIQANTPEDALVLTANAVSDYLYMRRHTLDYPRPTTDIEAYVLANGIDYVVVKPSIQSGQTDQLDDYTSALLAHLAANPARYTVAYTNTDYSVTVFQVQQSSSLTTYARITS